MGWIVYSEGKNTVFHSRDNLQRDVWNWGVGNFHKLGHTCANSLSGDGSPSVKIKANDTTFGNDLPLNEAWMSSSDRSSRDMSVSRAYRISPPRITCYTLFTMP
jgi:hypothetical protein